MTLWILNLKSHTVNKANGWCGWWYIIWQEWETGWRVRIWFERKVFKSQPSLASGPSVFASVLNGKTCFTQRMVQEDGSLGPRQKDQESSEWSSSPEDRTSNTAPTPAPLTDNSCWLSSFRYFSSEIILHHLVASKMDKLCPLRCLNSSHLSFYKREYSFVV